MKDLEKIKKIGTRNERKLRKFNGKFNEIFLFFLQSHRKGILTFSGSEDFKTLFNNEKGCGRECFRKFDNGQYSHNDEGLTIISTKHNNILYSVIKGKKSWGLWVKEWSLGISECCFTIDEILEEFKDCGILIPESMVRELENNILKMKIIRNDKYLKSIMK